MDNFWDGLWSILTPLLVVALVLFFRDFLPKSARKVGGDRTKADIEREDALAQKKKWITCEPVSEGRLAYLSAVVLGVFIAATFVFVGGVFLYQYFTCGEFDCF